MTFNTQTNLRITTEMLDRWKVAAGIQNLSLQGFIRQHTNLASEQAIGGFMASEVARETEPEPTPTMETGSQAFLDREAEIFAEGIKNLPPLPPEPQTTLDLEPTLTIETVVADTIKALIDPIDTLIATHPEIAEIAFSSRTPQERSEELEHYIDDHDLWPDDAGPEAEVELIDAIMARSMPPIPTPEGDPRLGE
jgi:hypothetical protein